MDRLQQAEVTLAAAASHDPAVLVPGLVTSPMDCCTTVPVARDLIECCDARAVPAPAYLEAAERIVALGRDRVVDDEMLRLSAGTPPAPAARDSA
jgi:hypothetical protein